MKNCFLRIFILIGLSLGLLFGTSGYAATRRPAKSVSNGRYTTIRGSENIVTRTKAAPAFHAVDASRGVCVVIGGTDKIVIEANDNVMDYVIAEVQNGKLRIGIDNSVNVRNMDVNVRIPNNGKIDAVSVSSAAEIRTESALKASDLSIRLSSAASLDAALKADRCTIRLSSGTEMKAAADFGSCDIKLSSGSSVELSGKSAVLTAGLSSGSSLEAFGLVARTCNVGVSSGAEAEITCTEKLTAQVSSGGSLEYKGDCSVDKRVSSGGSVRKH